MKSEELGEKVQEVVVGDVWRRKKEREAKFRAMRNLGRDQENEDTVIRDFAPGSSMFGGPTEVFSFFPAAWSSNLQRKGSGASSNNLELANPGGVTQSEHSLIARSGTHDSDHDAEANPGETDDLSIRLCSYQYQTPRRL